MASEVERSRSVSSPALTAGKLTAAIIAISATTISASISVTPASLWRTQFC